MKRQPGFMRLGEEVQDDDEVVGAEVERATPMHAASPSKPYPICGAKARTTGGVCQNPPLRGAKRCRMHGSKTQRSLEKAREKLDRLAYPAVTALGDVIVDPETPPGVKVAASNSVLNRTGFTERTAIEATVEVPAWERIAGDLVFSHLERGEGGESPTDDATLDRYSRTEAGDGNVIDAEVVEDEPDRAPADAAPSGGMEFMSWEDAYGEPTSSQRHHAEVRAAGREGRKPERTASRRTSDLPTEFDPTKQARPRPGGTRVGNSSLRRG